MTTASVSARGLLASDPLCKTFTAMARKIWRQLGQARAVGINRGEETVTDDFLLEVQEAHPAEGNHPASTAGKLSLRCSKGMEQSFGL